MPVWIRENFDQIPLGSNLDARTKGRGDGIGTPGIEEQVTRMISPNLTVIFDVVVRIYSYESTSPRNNTLVIARIRDHVRARRTRIQQPHAWRPPWPLSRGSQASQAGQAMPPPQAFKLAVGVVDRDAATSPSPSRQSACLARRCARRRGMMACKPTAPQRRRGIRWRRRRRVIRRCPHLRRRRRRTGTERE